MSFSVSISGHSNEKHNDAVARAVQAAVDILETVPGLTGSVSGYTWDGGGEENRLDLARSISAPTEPAEEVTPSA